MKCRIVSDEHDSLSAELSLDGEIFGEIVISDDDNRMNIVLYPDAELDLNIDLDRFLKVLGKGAERLWEMENDPNRVRREETDEEDDEEAEQAADDADGEDEPDLEDEDMEDMEDQPGKRDEESK